MKNKNLQHNFGYGSETEKINKLQLNNIKELKIYLSDLIKTIFETDSENTILVNNKKYKLFIKAI